MGILEKKAIKQNELEAKIHSNHTINIMKRIKLLTLVMLVSFSSISIGQNTKGNISQDVLNEIKKSVSNDADTRALINAVSANDIKKLVVNRENYGQVSHYFSNKVDVKGITNQKIFG